MLPNAVACPTHAVAPGAIYNSNSTTCVNSAKKLFVSNLPNCNINIASVAIFANF